FVGFDAEGNDGFAFVALEAIPAGQVIYFRDDEWNGTSFNTGEGRMSWTNDTGSAIAAGTVIELTNLSAGTLASSTGTAAKLSGSIALGNSDEALYAYTSTASDTAGTFTFLTAAANSTYSSAGASLAGTGLAAGTNALEFGNGFDVYAYDATTNGTAFDSQAAALAVLNNPAKWLSEDGSGNQDANGTVPDAPFLANSPLAGKSFSIGAASGEPDTPGSVQTFTPNPGTTKDSSDASAAIALDADWMIVGDDEANVLRVYPRAGGAAVAEWNYETNGPLLSGELDLEGATRIGNTLYFIGSHSNDKGGNEASSREAIFAVTVSGTGAATQFTYVDKYTGLESALGAWDASNAHGLGANHFGLAASAQNGVVPETVGGFSIEGLAASADGSQLLIAFRAPLEDTAARGHALIVPVETSSIFTATPVFDAPIELDLGGRGIRDIQRAPDGSFLIVAGPSGAATTDVTDDFRLFRWDGTSSTATSLDVALDPLLTATGGSFETIVEATSTAAGTLVQLLQDDGDTVWPGKSVASKDLPSSEQQFQGTWVELGANVTDTSGPVLASSAPSDGDAAVNGQSNIVLRFDEGVVRASGSFVIHRASDAGVVETIPAANAAFAYNTVTLDPAADLAEGTHYYIETTG
ncbi:MAG TPA: DUF3616 domain-containing protein, partial [Vicinamibacterales bacterium]|nr:DUF3616 domain-containing protein [Vicinamibacterales bacterium]